MHQRPATIYVEWKGRRTGPFDETEIRRLITEKSISAYHRLLIGEQATTVKEWLAAKPANPASVGAPPAAPNLEPPRAERAPQTGGASSAQPSTAWPTVLGGVLITGLVAGLFLSTSHNGDEASRAREERRDETVRTTAVAWARYKEAMRMDPARVSEDPRQAVADKAAALKGVLALQMDPELRRLIDARAKLLEQVGVVVEGALGEQEKINPDGALASVVAGMVAGILNPDDPLRAGVAAGGAISALSDEKVQGLARRVQRRSWGLRRRRKNWMRSRRGLA